MSDHRRIAKNGPMVARERFARLADDVDRDAVRLGNPRHASAESLAGSRRIFNEEIYRSTTLAGSRLPLSAVRSLVAGDVVSAGHTLADHILVSDYAEAARAVRAAPLSRRRRYLAVDEIATLHTLAVARTLGARPGRWRESTAPTFPSGSVPPPAWLVPREVTALVDRVGSGPANGTHRLVWAADAHARLLRLHPFDSGNGRVARLVVNLLLRRTGLPPFVVRPRDEVRYLAALRRADSRDPWPLAYVLARSVLESLGVLLASATDDGEGGDLAPLWTFASGAERAALYKAAQRGRLRSVPRGRTLLTSRAWIEEYRNARREATSDAHHPRDARSL